MLIRISGGEQTKSWDLDDDTQQQIAIASSLHKKTVETIFGPSDGVGDWSQMIEVADILAKLRKLGRALPGARRGFQVRCSPVPGNAYEVAATNMSGFLIKGRYHITQCYRTYW